MLQQNSANLSTSLARLSSGSKITSPADDSAGLAVSMKLTAQISRTGAAQDNVNNAISFNQTQDGYLQQVNTALTRMSELTVSAQDVTKTTADRQLYQQEFTTLQSYVSDVATKSFNGVSLFANNSGASVTLNVTSDGDGDSFAMKGVDLTATSYATVTNTSATSGATSYIDISSVGDQTVGGKTAIGAASALGEVTDAINKLASDRASIGSNEEALGYYNNQLSTLSNNLSAANSQITDVDVATESTNYAKNNILVQSATAMLAQANAMPQSVLRLIS